MAWLGPDRLIVGYTRSQGLASQGWVVYDTSTGLIEADWPSEGESSETSNPFVAAKPDLSRFAVYSDALDGGADRTRIVDPSTKSYVVNGVPAEQVRPGCWIGDPCNITAVGA